MNTATQNSVEDELLSVIHELLCDGGAWAQEDIVLRDTARRLHIEDDVAQQQALIRAWQNLFLTGRLCWGYDMNNPGHPFFHEVPHATSGLTRATSCGGDRAE